MKTLTEHFDATNGPKRILALDGGGIRGALTLGYLQKIEDILKAKSPDPVKFRLSDYFDLIGGTSTGSIIASCLAIGMTVKEITDMYLELGGKIFATRHKWWNVFDRIRASYDARPLEDELKKVFTDITLGDQRIKTGLCIVAKRADTNSVWPLLNHPGGRYFQHNKDILLCKAVRASAAAPTYFLPQSIDVGGKLNKAVFVDGGVSMANNPALQLLMVATLKGFPYQWQWGADKLSIVSVGTGMSKWDKIPDDIRENHLLNWAQQLPDMLMQDAGWSNQIILQWLSNSPTAWVIDREIGDLKDDFVGGNHRGLISYVRYNTWLDAESLEPLTKKKYSKQNIDDLVEMSNAASRFDLVDIGTKAAEKEVQPSHFN